MRLLRLLPLMLLAVALLGACSQAATPPAQPTTESTSVPSEQPAATAAGAYPAPDSAYPAPNNSAAYPGGEPPAPTVDSNPIVVPQPASAEVGVLTGTIFRIEGDQRTAIPGARLVLGTLLQTTEGVDAGVQLDRNVAPATTTNGLGQFVFADVPPGRYGLMFDAVEGVLLLNNPEDGGDMIIEITGGEVIDLGELAYPLPELN